MIPHIIPLHEIPDDGLTIAGGKALNLGRLMRASDGMRVPLGFCITTAAYDLAKGEGEAVSAMPDALAIEIADAYLELGGRVAVRSSATAEDLPEASFAGQQDTFLNVEGATDVLAAVLKCWASLFTERANAYRSEAGIGDGELSMAVVVQRMVDARAAGVLFTADPSTADPDRIHIEAVAGLGESLVSGEVTPDRWVVRPSGAPVETEITGNTPVLTEDELAGLAGLGLAVADLLGGPQDIEWALDAEGLHVLQARPITTLERAHELAAMIAKERARLTDLAGGETVVFSSYQAAEVAPTPTPMTAAILSRWLSHDGGHGEAHRALGYTPEATGGRILEVICGRAYFNLNEEARSYIAGAPYRPGIEALRANPSLAAMAIPKLDPTAAGCSFIFLVPMIMWKTLRASSSSQAARRTYAEELRDRVFPEFEATIAQERSLDLGVLSDGDLLAKIEQWTEHAMVDLGRHAIQPAILAGESLVAAEQALAKTRGPEEARALVQQLVAGGAENKTTEATTRLWQVAQGEVSMDAFLNEFGHRGPGELELASLRWREDPDMVQSMVDGLCDTPAPAGRIEAQRQAREETEVKLFSDTVRPLGPTRKLVEQQLAEARRYFPFREDPKHYMTMELELIRRALLILAERHGVGEGIFYLTPEELPDLAAGRDMSAVIGRRRRERRLALRVPLPDVIFSDELEAIGKPVVLDIGEGDLRGTGVSSGVATGTARVLTNPSDGHLLRAGEILVAPSTDPGWTPIVARAGGLVLERGGMLSHGAVVAREYGLPAVTNVSNATVVLTSGMQLRVDGSTGIVQIVS